mmetsp:Transcript_46242/g.88242  ORF Transcript_46242/g.88242 Transcript_46242/m.88242 type:complete len:739 (+) Transcript_46242:37-2253(+)
MAQKMLQVLLVDVGSSTPRDETTAAVREYLHTLISFRSKDEVALILYGANVTFNALNSEMENAGELGQYLNVYVVQNLMVPSVELIRKADDAFDNQGEEETPVDLLDALVVGIDMLNKAPRKCSASKVVVLSDLSHEVDNDEDIVGHVAQQMTAGNISLEVLRVHTTANSRNTEAVIESNTVLLQKLVAAAGKGGSVRPLTEALQVDRTTTVRRVKPTTIFRGGLELGPWMTVEVWVFKKTAEEKFPTGSKYSSELDAHDPEATHKVKKETMYRSTTDPDQDEIPPEKRVTAYKFGKQKVPVPQEVSELLKFKCEKGMQLVGFTTRKQVPRHYFTKDTNVVVPWPAKKNPQDRVGLEAAKAAKMARCLSALARALQESEQCALVRCAWRAGATSVVWGVLTPHLVDSGDFLLFNVIPFSEDVRDYTFPSFFTAVDRLQPSSKQLDAAEALVAAMDLTCSNTELASCSPALPGLIQSNPAITRFQALLGGKALDPSAQVPPSSTFMRAVQAPCTEAALQAQALFVEAFATEVTGTGKRKDALSSQQHQDSSKRQQMDVKPAELVFSPDKPISLDSLSAVRVEAISADKPLEDFHLMMKRTDGTEGSGRWVRQAMQGMQDLIQTSVLNGDAKTGCTSLLTALECARALRKACVGENIHEVFNELLQNLAKQFPQPRCAQFYEHLETAGLTLIAKHEVESSDVSATEAASFLERVQQKHNPDASAADKLVAADQDDFDDME